MRRIAYLLPIAFVVLAGFAGIVSADPCPADKISTSGPIFPAAGYGIVTTSGSLPTITYSVVNTGGLPLKGLCVYEKSGTTGAISGSDGFWTFHIEKGNPFNFENDGHGQVDITSGNSPQDVGSATFSISQDLSKEHYAFHLDDATKCASLNGQSTCWVAAGPGSPPPVPELNTMVLMAAGLLGLVIVSKKYKR